jgi:phosphate-selective porin OprO/OprP
MVFKPENKKQEVLNYKEKSTMKRKQKVFIGGALAVASLISTPLYAGEVAVEDAATQKLIRVLEQNGTITQKDAIKLRDAVSVQDAIEAKRTEEAIAKAANGGVKINNKGKLKIESADGSFKIHFNGRIMTDATFVDPDASNLDSGTELRRARLGIGGTFFKDWGFQLTPDFGQGSASITDAYVNYKGIKGTKITVGQHHAPFAMEIADSSKYMTFIERSIGSELIQGSSGPGNRRMGISSFHNGDDWTAQYGVFGTSLNGNDGTADDRVTYTGRATFAPINDKDANRQLHFGLGYAYQDMDNDNSRVRFRTRNGTHTNGRWLDSSVYGDSAQFFTADVAAVLGPLSVQAEYDAAKADNTSGTDVSVDSYFVQASYFITGESRNYNAKKGHFGSISPKAPVDKGGIGAWQLGARFASADMKDGTFNGGELDVFTAGINWYPVKNVRFMVNYNEVMDVKDGNVADDDEPSAIMLRSQIYF